MGQSHKIKSKEKKEWFYVYLSSIAIEYGGEDSATLVSIYELVAFFTKSPVHSQILKIADSGWENVVLSLFVIALSAFVTMFFFVRRWHKVLRKKDDYVKDYAPLSNNRQQLTRGVTP